MAAEPQAAARKIASGDPDVEDVHAFGSYLHLRVRSPEGPLERLPARLAEAGVNMQHLQLVTPTLEDVFIQLWRLESVPDGK